MITKKRRGARRVRRALAKYVKSAIKGNPPAKRVKGRKVKGGVSYSIRNFTGSVIRTSKGQVLIQGRGSKAAKRRRK
jgi:hypothetical protein